MGIKVFQIYMDKKTEARLEAGFEGHLNLKKDGYFENSVIREKYEENVQADYIGVTSWHQKDKTHFSAKEIIEHIQKDIDAGKGKDVYLYTPIQKCAVNQVNVPEGFDLNGKIRAMPIMTAHKFRGEPYTDDLLVNNAGILPFDLMDGKWQYCYCNYWIAKKSVFDEYCKTVLIPVMDFLERPDIKQKMPVWYKHWYDNVKYNSSCFIMEALFGSFLAHSPYSHEYIYKEKFGKVFKKINIYQYEPTNK